MANEISGVTAVLRYGTPKTMKIFSALATADHNDHWLDVKIKELITIAITVVVVVAVKCDGCIAFQLKAAGQSGTYKPELEPVRLGA